jgi:hypothetical protein
MEADVTFSQRSATMSEQFILSTCTAVAILGAAPAFSGLPTRTRRNDRRWKTNRS